MTVLVAVNGDATDITTWSGIPYHLLDNANGLGLPFEGLRLQQPPAWRRLTWNAAQVLARGSYGGFQYSRTYLNRLWETERERLSGGATVLNCFQLYPDWAVSAPAIAKWYYIDGTMTQLVEEYGNMPRASAGMIERIIDKERRGYQAASGVICHSRWAADCVIDRYGMDPSKVHVVVPGANFEFAVSQSLSQRAESGEAPGNCPLKLVFVGKYWDRKGLDRLLEAMIIAKNRGASLQLKVLGCDRSSLPEHLRDTPGVEWLGMVDKRSDAERFFALLRNSEVAVLLSRAEFGGMVLREFLALGLPIIGPDVGGAPEHASRTASILVAPEADPGEIAEHLIELATRGEVYRRLRTAAREQANQALWANSVEQLAAIIGPAART